MRHSQLKKLKPKWITAVFCLAKINLEVLLKSNSHAISSTLKTYCLPAKAGVRIADGRSKDKATAVIKSALLDSLGSLSKSYKQDQWELFAHLVNSGKAIKTLNKSRNSGKDKVKKEKDPVDFASVLAKVYNHADFDSLSLSTQDEIKDLLLEAGYELPET